MKAAGHHQEHGSNNGNSGNASTSLGIAIFVTLLIFVFQLVGAYLSNSLALLGDSGHVFSDAISLGVSFLACRLAMRPAELRKTFGYHRAEVFAALANAILLLIMAAAILYEALLRASSPPQINTPVMLAFAAIGLLGNAFVVIKLGGHKNLNVRSAMLHALSDAVSSLGVIIAAVLIWLTGMAVFDSIISAFIAGLMLIGSYRVGKGAMRILFEFSPKGIGASDICKALYGVPEVKEVHDVHVWAVCSDLIYATAHIVVKDKKVSGCEKLANKLESRLRKIGIAHATFQFETENHGHGKEMVCETGH